MSQNIRSSQVSRMIYHFVCPYRRNVFEEDVDEELKNICMEIEDRYEIRFLEIGTDNIHVHFLIQSIPQLSAARIINVIKTITAKELFRRYPKIKKELWGGQFWSDRYDVSTISQQEAKRAITDYIRNQGKEKEYQPLLIQEQLDLFE